MNGIREENLRLKTLLQQIEKDYKNLQMKLIDVSRQESKKSGSPVPAAGDSSDGGDDQELVSLRLGTCSTDNGRISSTIDDQVANKGGGSDGDRATSSSKNKERSWPAPVKTQRSSSNGDDEISQTSVKRARVCVRSRCDTPTVSNIFFFF